MITALRDTTLIVVALTYAAWAHRHQRRKSSGHPYVVHPARVARRLWAASVRDADVLAAALLHDVPEDTDYDVPSPPWPERVRELVELATEVKVDEDGRPIPWLDRKWAMFVACAGDPDAVALKAADLTDNLEDIARHGWRRISADRVQYGTYAGWLLGHLHGPLAYELLRACRRAGVSVVESSEGAR